VDGRNVVNALVISARRRRIVPMLLLPALFGIAIAYYLEPKLEAHVHPVSPLIDVVTWNPGRSAEEIRRLISAPIEIEMAGLQKLKVMRTISFSGLSEVKLQFASDVTRQQAEQWVADRLSHMAPLPEGVHARISPSSPIGEVFRYRVVGPLGYSVADLQTIEDWILARRFKAVPGVADVSGWGGKSEAYQIAIDRKKLIDRGLTVPKVLAALNAAGLHSEGQTVDFGPATAVVVRGAGSVHSLDHLGDFGLTPESRPPLVLSNVATVTEGDQPWLGIARRDDGDHVVQGMVLLRRGEQSAQAIGAVQAEMEKINASGVLPPGVHLEQVYDQGALISLVTHAVLYNLVFGIVVTFFVQWLFLGNLRSATILAATIPFALSFAIVIMTIGGESAAVVSESAIDFGLVADATVIMIGNIYRHLARRPQALTKAIVFSGIGIVAAVVPLVTLSGVEGYIFGPLARTYGDALLGALVATFAFVPALHALLPEQASETETIAIRALRRAYTPVFGFTFANRVATLGSVALIVAMALLAGRSLGVEFLPRLTVLSF
jgi:heavy metal efflux system protein